MSVGSFVAITYQSWLTGDMKCVDLLVFFKWELFTGGVV